MAYLAIRGAGAVNGVSRLHGQVSKELFEPLFSRWPKAEVPVGYVTNGIHIPSWDSSASDLFWREACGKDRWLGDLENVEKTILKVNDAKIWKLRNNARNKLVEFARERLHRQLSARGAPQEDVEIAKHIFDPHTLTLGFARRFATYKRPNMLLHDPERLLRILTNPDRPVQLIIAGKAHPEDKPGQALIKEWMNFIRNHKCRPHVIFISDYDMTVTQALVQGVDVWVNNPRRPWEACGTSGMKVLANGGLNLSELDGWWAEAYNPEVGWALGDGNEHGIDPGWDDAEASALYDILESKVVPEFYSRNSEGIPESWVQKIRQSMATLTPQYSANRTVREYTEKYYLPAATNYLSRAAEHAEKGKQQVLWQKELENHWRQIRFGEQNVESHDGQHQFEVQVYLDGLERNTVKIELYADGGNCVKPPECIEMSYVKDLAGEHFYLFQANVVTERLAADFTVRAVPNLSGVAVPLEAKEIAWQK